MSDSYSLRLANNNDYEAASSLLEDLDLPTEGMKEHFQDFIVVNNSDEIIGVFGIEIYESIGLLRSFGVKKKYQGKGFGAKLIDKMESYILEKNLDEVYLFSETADKMFAIRGYEYTTRDAADPIIQQSIEWQLCNSTPLLIKKL